MKHPIVSVVAHVISSVALVVRYLVILPACLVILLAPQFVSGRPPTIQLVVPSYDFPGGEASTTRARGISNRGAVVGTVNHPGIDVAGYERFASGQFSRPIIFPGSLDTSAYGINIHGIVCGTFIQNADHGFFYDGHTYTQYDVPGAVHTNITGENDLGDFCGYYFVDASVITPFLNVGGTVVSFSLPGINVVYPSAINNHDQVVGFYVDPADSTVLHGFFRDADGTLTYPLDYPGARVTYALGLNDKGVIVGLWGDPSYYDHAFLLKPPNHFVSWDYPQGFETTFYGINNSLLISGYYQSQSDNLFHSFIAQAVP